MVTLRKAKKMVRVNFTSNTVMSTMDIERETNEKVREN